MNATTTSAPAAAVRSTIPNYAAQHQDALAAGDHVESLHARRTGRVVFTYPDESACVCWDDRAPQEAGLGHERMPRELLIKVGSAEAEPADVPEVEQIEVHAPLSDPAELALEGGGGTAAELTGGEAHQIAALVAEGRRTNGKPLMSIAEAAAALKAASAAGAAPLAPETPPHRPPPARDAQAMAEREAYCQALFTVLHRHADDAAIDELCDTFEAMLDVLSARRPESALAQAWGDMFARFYVEGGV